MTSIRPKTAADTTASSEIAELREQVARLERSLTERQDQLHAAWAKELERAEARFVAHTRTLVRKVDELLDALGAHPEAVAALAEPPSETAVPSDLYAALEDRFRGSVEEITRRQERYVLDVGSRDVQGPVLDLGCGRGEFLEVLRRNRIDAIGVDSSEVAVAACRDAGLEVRHMDLLAALKERPDDSLRAVSMLQVAEHLPFDVLLEVLAEARRTIRPGGLLLVETPNGENVAVAASTFWLDPTHVRPIHPYLLAFLAEWVGFEVDEVRRSSPSFPWWRLDDDVPRSPVVDTVRGMQVMLQGDQDITLLAQVPD